MKMIKLVIFFIFAFINNIEASSKSMGPIGNLVINSVYECPEDERPTGDEVTWSAKIAGYNGGKSITASMTTKLPINDDINYVLLLKKWENGNWKKYYEHKGTPCADISKLISNFWSTVVPYIKPDPGRICPVEPNTYTVTNYRSNSKDVDLKSIFYGRLLLKLTGFDKDNNYIFCGMAEADSQAM